MGKKLPYNRLILKLNLKATGFEWLPDKEGIKTFNIPPPALQKLFEWLPDKEGINYVGAGFIPALLNNRVFKGNHKGLPLHLKTIQIKLPDKEGINYSIV